MSTTKEVNVSLTTKCRLAVNEDRNIGEQFHLADNVKPSSVIGSEIYPLSPMLKETSIRTAHQKGIPILEIAKKFNLCPRTVKRIIKRQTLHESR